jgi:hypothetical protein
MYIYHIYFIYFFFYFIFLYLCQVAWTAFISRRFFSGPTDRDYEGAGKTQPAGYIRDESAREGKVWKERKDGLEKKKEGKKKKKNICIYFYFFFFYFFFFFFGFFFFFFFKFIYFFNF